MKKNRSLKRRFEIMKIMTENKFVPFDKIKPEHFLPAIKEGIKEAKNNLESLRKNSAEPDFDNTIFALETAADKLNSVVLIFNVLRYTEANEKIDKLAEKILPIISEFYDDLYLDREIFARIKDAYEKRKYSGLNPEQIRLTEFWHKQFVRNGAFLNEKDEKKLREINRKLSKLSSRFGVNAKKSGNSFELVITDKERLKGLPEGALEAAATEAEKRKKPRGSYLFTLLAPSVIPVLKYADNRALREKIMRAYLAVGFGGKFDNQEIIKEITALRYEKSRLLGYKNHAQYVLAERMAKSPENARKFQDNLFRFTKPAAKKELAELEKFARKNGGPKKLQSWDTAYYEEKLKKEKFDFDSEDLRPYFKLENAIKGVFSTAEKLYGIKFFSVKAPVYHPDVKVFKVRDRDGRHLGFFYADFFPRKTKQSGAWAMTIREQSRYGEKINRPHVGISCNFTKPTPTKPALLTLGEVDTFFHEFGHALHHLFSDCAYSSLSGSNVLWDFVELPSQIMENWVVEKKVLDLFAIHYETGKKIPAELVEKIKKADKFMAGRRILGELGLGYLDLAYHGRNSAKISDVLEFERKTTNKTRILPFVSGACRSTRFSHIFDGGYDAGYYSYLWAEVLEADAFELFRTKGIFNRAVAGSFRKNILSRGNTEEPMVLYKKFRGRAPKINALLKKKGLH